MTNSSSVGLSASGSPSASIASRHVVKKRDKPYKLETQKVLAKKRKLDIHVRGCQDNATTRAFTDVPIRVDIFQAATTGLHFHASWHE